jgi:hypothetical protein
MHPEDRALSDLHRQAQELESMAIAMGWRKLATVARLIAVGVVASSRPEGCGQIELGIRELSQESEDPRKRLQALDLTLEGILENLNHLKPE